MSRRARGERAAVHIAVILLVIAVLAPFLWLLQMSVKTQEEIFAFPPKLLFAPTFDRPGADAAPDAGSPSGTLAGCTRSGSPSASSTWRA